MFLQMKGFAASASFRGTFSNIYYFRCRMSFGRKGYDTTEAHFPSLRTANACAAASHTRYAGGRLKSEHVWTAVIVFSFFVFWSSSLPLLL